MNKLDLRRKEDLVEKILTILGAPIRVNSKVVDVSGHPQAARSTAMDAITKGKQVSWFYTPCMRLVEYSVIHRKVYKTCRRVVRIQWRQSCLVSEYRSTVMCWTQTRRRVTKCTCTLIHVRRVKWRGRNRKAAPDLTLQCEAPARCRRLAWVKANNRTSRLVTSALDNPNKTTPR